MASKRLAAQFKYRSARRRFVCVLVARGSTAGCFTPAALARNTLPNSVSLITAVLAAAEAATEAIGSEVAAATGVLFAEVETETDCRERAKRSCIRLNCRNEMKGRNGYR